MVKYEFFYVIVQVYIWRNNMFTIQGFHGLAFALGCLTNLHICLSLFLPPKGKIILAALGFGSIDISSVLDNSLSKGEIFDILVCSLVTTKRLCPIFY